MFESSVIRAVVFDLDGTLVETEHLKAETYAALIGSLTGKSQTEEAAIELYREKVGAPDLPMCDEMIARFSLESKLDVLPGESPRTALHRARMALYREQFGTPGTLRKLAYSHNINLARQAHAEGLKIAVATMSFSDEAQRVLETLGLSGVVETVVGMNHIENPKPAPDAFLLAMERLGVKPSETLVIEDSPTGSTAAAASGARWICVATPFSTAALKAQTALDPTWIAWDPADLQNTVKRRIQPAH
jgi:beta-phosphoglucomutase